MRIHGDYRTITSPQASSPRLPGVMTAQGLQILDAQIITRNDGVVVDTFKVSDPDYAGVPPDERRASNAATIVRVLKGEEDVGSG